MILNFVSDHEITFHFYISLHKTEIPMKESATSPAATIHDVAIAAGVSDGTVDRVIHNRSGVSEKTRRKVLEKIEELGFKPNVAASLLAFTGKKRQLVVCLIPEFKKGEIWEVWMNGIIKGEEYASRLNVSVEMIFYDQRNSKSFQECCTKAVDMEPSVVIVAPMFRANSIKFAKELSARDIPVVFIDTKPDVDDYLGFFGMPMYESGFLGAFVLTDGREDSIREIVDIRIKRDSKSLSDPMLMRRTGFEDYINSNLEGCRILDVVIDPNDQEDIDEKLDEVFEGGKETRYLVMFNSRSHLVASYLSRKKVKNCILVGYDMLEKNLQGLRDGYIHAIIAQHFDDQAYRALVMISDYLVLGKEFPKRDNYGQMDILNAYNCDYYKSDF